MDKILIIGACGQLGTELTAKLRALKGQEHVIASDLRDVPVPLIADGIYEQLDIMDKNAFQEVLKKHKITQVYHLAAILSAVGEQNPQFAWQLNMDSLLTVLEAGRDHLKRIYWPSSIAVFGPETPKKATPQYAVMNPNTVYGISKLAGERWCEYYAQKYDVDVRSLRYPGLIGYRALPGGGTTDYAVDIFHKAIAGNAFQCYLEEDTYLPMMFMDDAVKATVDLMEADSSKVKVRSSYNVSAMSFSPRNVAAEIKKYFPQFEMTCKPDFRQMIADSWPQSINDTPAREDWGWQHQYELEQLAKVMIQNLQPKTVA